MRGVVRRLLDPPPPRGEFALVLVGRGLDGHVVMHLHSEVRSPIEVRMEAHGARELAAELLTAVGGDA